MIVMQKLEQPEVLTDVHTYVLLLSERDVVTRTYKNTKEINFTGKKFDELAEFLVSKSELASLGTDRIQIVKHVPHEFQWKKLDP